MLSVNKTKELTVDFREKEARTHTCVYIMELSWSR